MDPNQNNPSNPDPNNPSPLPGLPGDTSAQGLGSVPSSDNPSPLSPPAGMPQDISSLGAEPPPPPPFSPPAAVLPSDPIPPVTGQGMDGFSAQPDTGNFSPPPPPEPPVEPALSVNNNPPSGVPGWVNPSAPSPSTGSPLGDSLPNDLSGMGSGSPGGDSGFGGVNDLPANQDLGSVSPAPLATEPMPTFTPPVAGDVSSPLGGSDLPAGQGGNLVDQGTSFGSAGVAVSQDSFAPQSGTDQTGIGVAPEPLPSSQPEPAGSEFPPTWPPAPSVAAAGSFDMGASVPGESGSGEAGPTDLSHLMGSSVGGEATPPQPAPVATTLMSSPPAGSEAPANPQPADANSGVSQAVTSAPSGGFPKLILLALGMVLLVVVAASAYFILGVGSSGEEQQTSLPAEQAPLTNPPRTVLPPPAVSPVPSTPSASFGNLEGSVPPPSTPSGQSGSSALELLRQRQGR